MEHHQFTDVQRSALRQRLCERYGRSADDIREGIPFAEFETFLRYLDELPTAVCRLSNPDGKYYPTLLKARVPIGSSEISSRMVVNHDWDIIEAWRETSGSPPFPSFQIATPPSDLYFDLNVDRTLQVGVVTPGGIAPGLNTVIHGIVSQHERYARAGTAKVNIIGFRNGFRGVIDGQTLPLTPDVTALQQNRGGSLIGTGRYSKSPEAVQAIVDAVIANYQLDILYVIGGDGSLATAHSIHNSLTARQHNMVVLGLPKTIDNDLFWVWTSFGLDSAVQKAVEELDNLHTEAETNRRIAIVILMGAGSGYIAANTSLASGNADLVLVPEVHSTVDWKKVVTYVDTHILRNGEGTKSHAVLIVAEGLAEHADIAARWMHLPNASSEDKRRTLAQFLYELFRANLAAELGVFTSDPGHLIRAVAPTPTDRTLCRRLAHMAVHSALAGFTDCMVSHYLTEFLLVPLEAVVSEEGGKGGKKRIPPDGRFWAEVRASTGQDDSLLL